MKSLTLPILSVVVLILATVSIVRTQPTRESHAPPAMPPQSPFVHRVAAVGLVEPSTEIVVIGSHLSGVVESVLIQAGQVVRKGDPLIKLDTRSLESARGERRADLAVRMAAIASAEAAVGRESARLDEANKHLKFAEALTDSRSLSAEELSRRRSAVEVGRAGLAEAEAGVVSARAALTAAEAALKSVETELERSTVLAPIDGTILQLRVRAGEFVSAGPTAHPWLMMGRLDPLHVRVDVDEHEAWRIRGGKKAVGQIRGNSRFSSPLSFVRMEPYVVPKQSLTGASSERVDTRVLQAVYRIEKADLPVFVGQQLDVFIEAEAPAGTSGKTL